jgi:hypothetical protein
MVVFPCCQHRRHNCVLRSGHTVSSEDVGQARPRRRNAPSASCSSAQGRRGPPRRRPLSSGPRQVDSAEARQHRPAAIEPRMHRRLGSGRRWILPLHSQSVRVQPFHTPPISSSSPIVTTSSIAHIAQSHRLIGQQATPSAHSISRARHSAGVGVRFNQQLLHRLTRYSQIPTQRISTRTPLKQEPRWGQLFAPPPDLAGGATSLNGLPGRDMI